MLNDFFGDSLMSPGRSLLRDTFKIDIDETEQDYRVEAELPGVAKEEIDLNADDKSLCITVNRTEEVKRNFIHRERRFISMSRRVRLAGANLDDIKAKLEDGVLTVTIPKMASPTSCAAPASRLPDQNVALLSPLHNSPSVAFDFGVTQALFFLHFVLEYCILCLNEIDIGLKQEAEIAEI